jgi:hypothetical protein
MKSFKKVIALSLLLVTPLFFFCSNDPTEPVINQPPTMPPLSTMVMDYGDFTSASLAKAEGKGNWLWAVGNVAFWNTALTVTMAVPVAAFAESFDHPPLLKSDGSWLWSYNFNLGVLQYTAELYAKPGLNGIKWNMYITLYGVFDEFHWFTGTSDYQATNGYWLLNLRPLEPEPFLQIDWTRDIDTQALDITYTNIRPDGDENGSYIHQALNQEGEFTGLYDIYRVTTENLVEIKWNRESLQGRIKDQKHFEDTEWHCWDSSFENTTCE